MKKSERNSLENFVRRLFEWCAHSLLQRGILGFGFMIGRMMPSIQAGCSLKAAHYPMLKNVKIPHVKAYYLCLPV